MDTRRTTRSASRSPAPLPSNRRAPSGPPSHFVAAPPAAVVAPGRGRGTTPNDASRVYALGASVSAPHLNDASALLPPPPPPPHVSGVPATRDSRSPSPAVSAYDEDAAYATSAGEGYDAGSGMSEIDEEAMAVDREAYDEEDEVMQEMVDDQEEFEEGAGDSESSEPAMQRSDGEWERIEEEIRDMENVVEGVANYEVVDKLGEGTFSSVYKAVDLHHNAYDNSDWDRDDIHHRKKVYVALKRIYVTSSPQRILNELELMEDLRPCAYVSYLITAFRTEDQIVAVMPYSRHTDFREYYRIIPIGDLRFYFRCLFKALDGCHAASIIHRDVKPANFLYDPRTGEGTLCDFGLAERFEPSDWRGKCHHTLPTPEAPHGVVAINKDVPSLHFLPGGALAQMKGPCVGLNSGVIGVSSKNSMGPPERVGYNKADTRPGARANRAGTRGFRAPEVLLKCQDQTTALDMWSAGIILLAFLTKRFPLFNSNDDTEALLELMMVFGKKRIAQCALLHNRKLETNIPVGTKSPQDGYRIPQFVQHLNPGILEAPRGADPQEYAKDVEDVLDLCRVLLHPDCTRRWSARQALQHEFLKVRHEGEEALAIET